MTRRINEACQEAFWTTRILKLQTVQSSQQQRKRSAREQQRKPSNPFQHFRTIMEPKHNISEQFGKIPTFIFLYSNGDAMDKRSSYGNFSRHLEVQNAGRIFPDFDSELEHRHFPLNFSSSRNVVLCGACCVRACGVPRFHESISFSASVRL